MSTKQVKDFDAVVTPATNDKILVQQTADNVTRYITPQQVNDLEATVGQAEAEAGTATTRRIWTAERVKQAIKALVTPLTANLNFANFQAVNLKLENAAADLTPAQEGRLVYQTTLNQLQADDGTNVQHVPTIASVAQGDVIYASAAKQWARLAKGTAKQSFRMNAGATAPEWFSLLTGLSSLAIARRTTDSTPVNGSTTLVNDDTLLLPLAANDVLIFLLSLHYNSGATPDFKLAFTAPASPTRIRWAAVAAYHDHTGGVAVVAPVTSSGGTRTLNGAGADSHALFAGIVTNGANAGNWQLQFAQNTSDASDTKILADSFLLGLYV